VRLLLDTHVLFWWLIDEARLSPQAFDKIRTKDDEVFVSVASAWEMAIKVGSGKWPEARALLDDFEGLVSAENFSAASNVCRTCSRRPFVGGAVHAGGTDDRNSGCHAPGVGRAIVVVAPRDRAHRITRTTVVLLARRRIPEATAVVRLVPLPPS